ncbi:MAG: hypothetical protein H0V22_04040 [Solirubrobacterales bacterium]|nr:hypothetical protein [Solirubrobacterales bacterium]
MRSPRALRAHDVLLTAQESEIVAALANARGHGGIRVVRDTNALGHGVELVQDPTIRQTVLRWFVDRLEDS